MNNLNGIHSSREKHDVASSRSSPFRFMRFKSRRQLNFSGRSAIMQVTLARTVPSRSCQALSSVFLPDVASSESELHVGRLIFFFPGVASGVHGKFKQWLFPCVSS